MATVVLFDDGKLAAKLLVGHGTQIVEQRRGLPADGGVRMESRTEDDCLGNSHCGVDSIVVAMELVRVIKRYRD